MKARAFQQRKNATATLRERNDDCRHIGKISVIQRHLFAMRGHSGNQLTADGDFHGFHRRYIPSPNGETGGENSRNNVTFYFEVQEGISMHFTTQS